MSKNYYDILWVAKNATTEEIKKAYKKQAMKYHPDRNKWDKEAEKKFKEINEAYQTLWDETKKKNYDQFGSSDFGNFGGWNPFGGWFGGNSGFDFGDIFGNFGGWKYQNANSFDFDFSEFFSGWNSTKTRQNTETQAKKEDENLDVTETIEIPFMDFLFDTQISIRTVYGKNLTLKVKQWTKPGTKFKIAGEWRKNNWKTGNMFVIVEAKMPKEIPEHIKKMIEAIRYEL